MSFGCRCIIKREHLIGHTLNVFFHLFIFISGINFYEIVFRVIPEVVTQNRSESLIKAHIVKVCYRNSTFDLERRNDISLVLGRQKPQRIPDTHILFETYRLYIPAVRNINNGIHKLTGIEAIGRIKIISIITSHCYSREKDQQQPYKTILF